MYERAATTTIWTDERCVLATALREDVDHGLNLLAVQRNRHVRAARIFILARNILSEAIE